MLTPKPGSACIPSSLDEESGSIFGEKGERGYGRDRPDPPAQAGEAILSVLFDLTDGLEEDRGVGRFVGI